MTDNNAFERFVADHLADDGSGTAQAERIAALIDEQTGERRPWPRWLALIKEPPMRIDSRVTVGSPAVRIAAILVATMLLALSLAAAGIAGQRLLAAGGPIIVAQDGSGHYTSINEAVAVAEVGDEVLVKPGIYPEVVVIDKDITLRGDGPREEVILEFGSDGPTIRTTYGMIPYGIMLVGSEAIISDLTVNGPNIGAAFVFIGGAPTLERVANDLEGDWFAGPHTSVAVENGAGGTIRDSVLDGPAWEIGMIGMPEYADISGSSLVVVEDNVTNSNFGFDVTEGSTFVRNTMTDGGGIYPSLVGGGSVLIAENDLATIEFESDSSDGFTIRDNVIRGTDSGVGIVLGTGATVVEGNTISGASTGIIIPEGATATISGNQLEGLRTGIRIDEAESDVVIEDNRFCGNDDDLVVPEGSSLTLDPSNEICEDDTTE